MLFRSIYLAIAALIRAGLDGIRRGLAAPPDIQCDPDSLGVAERNAKNVRVLPESLDAVITAAGKDSVLLSQFPPLLVEALMSVRRDDVRMGGTIDAAEFAGRLAKVY